MRFFSLARRFSNTAPAAPCITIKDCAKEHLNHLLKQKKNSHIKLSLISGGCNGFRYCWDWVSDNDLCQKDEIIDLDNGKFIVDSRSVFYVLGSELYFKKNDFDAAFEFKNPKASAQCGCGESFSV